jgi:tryptophan 2,3-dioxygenase
MSAHSPQSTHATHTTTPDTASATAAPGGGQTTYERYLRTDELLALQKPPTERLHPDELVFQITHQTFELWWKLTLELLAAATDALRAADVEDATIALHRTIAAQEVVRAAMRQLELVPPADFLVIRKGLGDGNGGDSPGWRGILRATPGLWDAFVATLDHAGVALVDLYAHPRARPTLYACAEALTDFDEQFHLFRAAHLKLAQRHLGLQSTGTGGMPMAAMERSLHHLLFPALWQARDELVARANQSASEEGAQP